MTSAAPPELDPPKGHRPLPDGGPARAEIRRPPPPPLLVLTVAALLPGMGQVMNGMTTRALTFIFFMFMLGMVSWHLTTPAHSFVGRHAGGFLVYAISVLDAYRLARWRAELHRTRLAQP